MSKAKRLEWLRKYNKKWRQRQASRDGNFIIREKGRLLTYKRINGIKPPLMRSASPHITIDSERIVFAGSNRGLASFVRDYKKVPSAQSVEVIDETSTLSVEAIDQMLKAKVHRGIVTFVRGDNVSSNASLPANAIDQMLKAMFNHTVQPSDNTALPSA